MPAAQAEHHKNLGKQHSHHVTYLLETLKINVNLILVTLGNKYFAEHDYRSAIQEYSTAIVSIQVVQP